MIRRWQPPALSPVAPAALARALPAMLARQTSPVETIRRTLASHFGASAVALTDSGTSALVLAFRFALRKVVALPAYACVDLLAAAAYAQLRVRFYDVDPKTMSPDLASVRRVLDRGVDGIVVAHLYGFPADVPGVASLAAEHGTVVIEDAAQHAGGSLGGTPLGAFGPLTVLSFGRGKGITGGGGGALLARDARLQIDEWQRAAPSASTGWRQWAQAAALWAIARPSLYALPASLPALHLGETIYKEAHEPRRLPLAAGPLLEHALAAAGAERDSRAASAQATMAALAGADRLDVVREIPGGASGYLRLPVLDRANRAAAPRLGVVRTYPRPLNEEPAARSLVMEGELATPGARVVCEQLFTLPTHAGVNASDREQLTIWARHSRSQ